MWEPPPYEAPDGRPEHDQPFPHPYRNENAPIGPSDVAIQTEGKKSYEHQQTGVHYKLTETKNN